MKRIPIMQCMWIMAPYVLIWMTFLGLEDNLEEIICTEKKKQKNRSQRTGHQPEPCHMSLWGRITLVRASVICTHVDVISGRYATSRTTTRRYAAWIKNILSILEMSENRIPISDHHRNNFVVYVLPEHATFTFNTCYPLRLAEPDITDLNHVDVRGHVLL